MNNDGGDKDKDIEVNEEGDEVEEKDDDKEEKREEEEGSRRYWQRNILSAGVASLPVWLQH